jgi:CheY-like chemotaxis protein
LKLASVDLATVAHAAVDSLRPAFEKRGQVASFELAESLRAHADPTRLSQILANLLHNASKFTPQGGSIRVELTREADQAVFRVIDSGAGIAPDQMERVFDMFSRIAPPGLSEPGLGIGLALGRRLAQMHNGTLEGFSEGDGRGTTFTLRIPLLFEPREQEPAATNGAAVHGGAAALHIVLVEDNEDIAATLTDWLEALGHRVSAAATGTRGLELIEQSSPALVLCDLGLPEMDGLDVCRRVRQLPPAAQPVMVALTGWGRNDDRGRTKAAGFDHHLVKPVDPDSLQEVLSAVARSRSSDASRVV